MNGTDPTLELLWKKIGADTIASLDEFTKDMQDSQDLRRSVWKKIGADKIDSFEQFEKDFGFVTDAEPQPVEPKKQAYEFDWKAAAKKDLSQSHLQFSPKGSIQEYGVNSQGRLIDKQARPKTEKSLSDIAALNPNTPFGQQFGSEADPLQRYKTINEVQKLTKDFNTKQKEIERFKQSIGVTQNEADIVELNKQNLELLSNYEDNKDFLKEAVNTLNEQSDLKKEKALSLIPAKEFYNNNFAKTFDGPLASLSGDFAEWMTDSKQQELFKGWSTDPNFNDKKRGFVIQQFINSKQKEIEAGIESARTEDEREAYQAYQKLLNSSYATFLNDNPKEREGLVKQIEKQRELQVQPEDSAFKASTKIVKAGLKSAYNIGVNLLVDTFVKLPKAGSDLLRGLAGEDIDTTDVSDRFIEWTNNLVDNVTFDLPELKDEAGIDPAGAAATISNVIGSLVGLRAVAGALSKLGSGKALGALKGLSDAQKASILAKAEKFQKGEQFIAGLMVYAPRTIESYKEQGLSDSDALTVGLLSSGISSVIEMISPGIPFGTSLTKDAYLKLAKEGATRGTILKEIGKGLFANNVNEIGEELLDDWVNQVILPGAYNEISGQNLKETSLSEYINEDALNTMFITAVATGIFGGALTVGSGQFQEIDGFVDAVKNIDTRIVTEKIQNWVESGQITTEQGSDFLQFIQKQKSEVAKNEGLEAEIKEPSQEQILDDLKNKNYITSEFDSEDKVPEIWKDKISVSTINGKKKVRVTLLKSVFEYESKTGRKYVEPKETTKAGSGGVVDVIENKINEARLIENDAERKKALDEIFNSDEYKNYIADAEYELKNNPTQVADGKGTWRKQFNDTKDAMRKKDILRAVADVSTDKAELNDISEAAKGLPEGLQSEINHAVEHKLQSLKETTKAPKVEEQQQELSQKEEKITTEDVIKEIKTKKLSRVSGLKMGTSQADGVYISTEKKNRYETKDNKSKQVSVNIKNPFLVTEDTGLVSFRNNLLNRLRSQFTKKDSVTFSDLPNRDLTVDDLNESGIKKLSKFVTEELTKQGYDSIYFKESNVQEGELVIFDKNNLEVVEEEYELKVGNDIIPIYVNDKGVFIRKDTGAIITHPDIINYLVSSKSDENKQKLIKKYEKGEIKPSKVAEDNISPWQTDIIQALEKGKRFLDSFFKRHGIGYKDHVYVNLKHKADSEKGGVSADQFLDALARKHNVEYDDLEGFLVDVLKTGGAKNYMRSIYEASLENGTPINEDIGLDDDGRLVVRDESGISVAEENADVSKQESQVKPDDSDTKQVDTTKQQVKEKPAEKVEEKVIYTSTSATLPHRIIERNGERVVQQKSGGEWKDVKNKQISEAVLENFGLKPEPKKEDQKESFGDAFEKFLKEQGGAISDVDITKRNLNAKGTTNYNRVTASTKVQRTVLATIKKLGSKLIGVKTYVHESIDSYANALSDAGYPAERAKSSNAFYDGKAIHVFLGSPGLKNNTFLHEGVHAVISAKLKDNKAVLTKWVSQLYTDSALFRKYFTEYAGREYDSKSIDPALVDEEAVTEFLADKVFERMLEDANTDRNLFDKLKEWFRNLLRRLGYRADVINPVLSTDEDVFSFANRLADLFKMGAVQTTDINKVVEQSLKETTKAETPTPKGNTSNVGGDVDLKNEYDKDILYGLKQRAKHFDNFKDFSHDYSIKGNHGIYFHLTDNPNFKYSAETGARDMSSMASGSASEKGSLMVTSDLQGWHDYYNLDPDTELPRDKGGRKYVAIVDLSNVKKIPPTERGFGHEIYLNKLRAKNAKVVKVVPIEEALKIDKDFHDKMPQSEKALKKIWDEAQKNKPEKIGVEDKKFNKISYLQQPTVDDAIDYANRFGKEQKFDVSHHNLPKDRFKTVLKVDGETVWEVRGDNKLSGYEMLEDYYENSTLADKVRPKAVEQYLKETTKAGSGVGLPLFQASDFSEAELKNKEEKLRAFIRKNIPEINTGKIPHDEIISGAKRQGIPAEDALEILKQEIYGFTPDVMRVVHAETKAILKKIGTKTESEKTGLEDRVYQAIQRGLITDNSFEGIEAVLAQKELNGGRINGVEITALQYAQQQVQEAANEVDNKMTEARNSWTKSYGIENDLGYRALENEFRFLNFLKIDLLAHSIQVGSQKGADLQSLQQYLTDAQKYAKKLLSRMVDKITPKEKAEFGAKATEVEKASEQYAKALEKSQTDKDQKLKSGAEKEVSEQSKKSGKKTKYDDLTTDELDKRISKLLEGNDLLEGTVLFQDNDEKPNGGGDLNKNIELYKLLRARANKVIKELQKKGTFPTADEVYLKMKDLFPKLSKDAFYKAMVFGSEGAINEATKYAQRERANLTNFIKRKLKADLLAKAKMEKLLRGEKLTPEDEEQYSKAATDALNMALQIGLSTNELLQLSEDLNKLNLALDKSRAADMAAKEIKAALAKIDDEITKRAENRKKNYEKKLKDIQERLDKLANGDPDGLDGLVVPNQDKLVSFELTQARKRYQNEREKLFVFANYLEHKDRIDKANTVLGKMYQHYMAQGGKKALASSLFEVSRSMKAMFDLSSFFVQSIGWTIPSAIPGIRVLNTKGLNKDEIRALQNNSLSKWSLHLGGNVFANWNIPITANAFRNAVDIIAKGISIKGDAFKLAAIRHNEDIKSTVFYDLAERAGVDLSEVGDISQREDFFHSDFFKTMANLPTSTFSENKKAGGLLKAIWKQTGTTAVTAAKGIQLIKEISEEIYIYSLNEFKVNQFRQAVMAAGAINDPDYQKFIARQINIQFGTAKIASSDESALTFLDNNFWKYVFFAPHLFMNRIRQVFNYGTSPVRLAAGVITGNKKAQKEEAYKIIHTTKALASYGALMYLAELLGLEWDDDPRSSTFMKLKYGDKPLDMTGGFAPIWKMFGRTTYYAGQNEKTPGKAIRSVVGPIMKYMPFIGVEDYFTSDVPASLKGSLAMSNFRDEYVRFLTYKLHPSVSLGVVTGANYFATGDLTDAIGKPIYSEIVAQLGGDPSGWLSTTLGMASHMFMPIFLDQLSDDILKYTDKKPETFDDYVYSFWGNGMFAFMGANTTDYEDLMKAQEIQNYFDSSKVFNGRNPFKMLQFEDLKIYDGGATKKVPDWMLNNTIYKSMLKDYAKAYYAEDLQQRIKAGTSPKEMERLIFGQNGIRKKAMRKAVNEIERQYGKDNKPK